MTKLLMGGCFQWMLVVFYVVRIVLLNVIADCGERLQFTKDAVRAAFAVAFGDCDCCYDDE